MLGHQHVFKKHPFDAINPFLRATILEAYPTKSQKVDSSKNPAQFLVAIFLIFSKKKTVFKRKPPNKLLPQISLPGHGARFRGFGGFRFLASGTGCLGVVENPHAKSPGKVAVENRCLLEGYRFFGWECEVWSYVWKPFFKNAKKKSLAVMTQSGAELC